MNRTACNVMKVARALLFASVVCAATVALRADDDAPVKIVRNPDRLEHPFTLLWHAAPGWHYRIQTTPHLAGPWTLLAEETIVATQGMESFDIPALALQHAFFRVVRLEPAGMMLIPAGSFQMGDSFNDSLSLWGERPVHTVYVSAFYMDRTEVTKALWDEVRAWGMSNGYTDLPAGQGKESEHPVIRCNWYDAVKWMNARSEKEGRVPAYYTNAERTAAYRTGDVDVQNEWVRWNAGYRLPTEAEWEKAARGGEQGRRFSWGNTISHSQANYYASSSYSYDVSPTQGYHPTFATGDEPYTSPVGSFEANSYGLYDMAGNVWEWCWDWHSSSYYSSSPGTDPRGPSMGTRRVLRGGSWAWFGKAIGCRSARRSQDEPYWGLKEYGFRSVLAPGQ
jgi:formylglycine-generating enzyme required for sulfatase activity